MTNFEQQEILQDIVAKLQAQFPEVRLVSVEDITPYEFWVNLIEPTDEDRLLKLEELEAELRACEPDQRTGVPSWSPRSICCKRSRWVSVNHGNDGIESTSSAPVGVSASLAASVSGASLAGAAVFVCDVSDPARKSEG